MRGSVCVWEGMCVRVRVCMGAVAGACVFMRVRAWLSGLVSICVERYVGGQGMCVGSRAVEIMHTQY